MGSLEVADGLEAARAALPHQCTLGRHVEVQRAPVDTRTDVSGLVKICHVRIFNLLDMCGNV